MLRREPQLSDFRPDTVQRAVNVVGKLARYHRLEVRHLDRIPEGPAILVGNHSGGLSIVDGLFLVEYYRHFGFTEPVYILAHDMAFRVGWLRRWMGEVGIVRAGRDRARRVIEGGHKLLVFPGGDVEAMRPFSERAVVNLAGRTGWARLALNTSTPVVPLVTAGSHETLVILTQGKGLARLLGMPRWARLDSFPALLCLPWGILAGPSCALPYVPLPAKVTVEIGEPMLPSFWQDLSGEPNTRIRAMYNHVQSQMQLRLTRLYEERALPILG